MKVALIGAELEENLGLRYMASGLEKAGHHATIIPFNFPNEITEVVSSVGSMDPDIVGLSVVFTNRAKEFCHLAERLRENGYSGHIIAGGPFAAFNACDLLRDFPSISSVGFGEGESILNDLCGHLDDPGSVAGLYYRDGDLIKKNVEQTLLENIDDLSFPKRDSFHEFFGKPIASVLSSRGCWRNCLFCSINAWYSHVKGRTFRTRSVGNLVSEMKELYFSYGVRIFNFQDDNFFLPDHKTAFLRFSEMEEGLSEAGIKDIAIAVKARPDSITLESAEVMNRLGLFRVFLGVENVSQNGLDNLNRQCSVNDIYEALRILNGFDVHIAYNILMFEPETTLDDIRTNLQFMESHVENPMNFCRAEVHACTGLEEKLKKEGGLTGDYFRLDYHLKNPEAEAFHRIANYGFFGRNFDDFGLHYFNMQVDFYFQILKRFYPDFVNRSLRGFVRNFIKKTNLDTYQKLNLIYDFIRTVDPGDNDAIVKYAKYIRCLNDEADRALHREGRMILDWMTDIYDRKSCGSYMKHVAAILHPFADVKNENGQGRSMEEPNILNIIGEPVPYEDFRIKYLIN